MPKTDPAREALLTALEASGVHIPLWDGILIEDTVAIAPGATILPGCILRGKTTVAAGSVIGPGSQSNKSDISTGTRSAGGAT